MKRITRLGTCGLLAGLTLLVACGGGPITDHTTLDGNLESLRSAFNADTGKVRAIFLASPT